MLRAARRVLLAPSPLGAQRSLRHRSPPAPRRPVPAAGAPTASPAVEAAVHSVCGDTPPPGSSAQRSMPAPITMPASHSSVTAAAAASATPPVAGHAATVRDEARQMQRQRKAEAQRRADDAMKVRAASLIRRRVQDTRQHATLMAHCQAEALTSAAFAEAVVGCELSVLATLPDTDAAALFDACRRHGDPATALMVWSALDSVRRLTTPLSVVSPDGRQPPPPPAFVAAALRALPPSAALQIFFGCVARVPAADPQPTTLPTTTASSNVSTSSTAPHDAWLEAAVAVDAPMALWPASDAALLAARCTERLWEAATPQQRKHHDPHAAGRALQSPQTPQCRRAIAAVSAASPAWCVAGMLDAVPPTVLGAVAEAMVAVDAAATAVEWCRLALSRRCTERSAEAALLPSPKALDAAALSLVQRNSATAVTSPALHALGARGKADDGVRLLFHAGSHAAAAESDSAHQCIWADGFVDRMAAVLIGSTARAATTTTTTTTTVASNSAESTPLLTALSTFDAVAPKVGPAARRSMVRALSDAAVAVAAHDPATPTILGALCGRLARFPETPDPSLRAAIVRAYAIAPVHNSNAQSTIAAAADAPSSTTRGQPCRAVEAFLAAVPLALKSAAASPADADAAMRPLRSVVPVVWRAVRQLRDAAAARKVAVATAQLRAAKDPIVVAERLAADLTLRGEAHVSHSSLEAHDDTSSADILAALEALPSENAAVAALHFATSVGGDDAIVTLRRWGLSAASSAAPLSLSSSVQQQQPLPLTPAAASLLRAVLSHRMARGGPFAEDVGPVLLAAAMTQIQAPAVEQASGPYAERGDAPADVACGAHALAAARCSLPVLTQEMVAGAGAVVLATRSVGLSTAGTSSAATSGAGFDAAVESVAQLVAELRSDRRDVQVQRHATQEMEEGSVVVVTLDNAPHPDLQRRLAALHGCRLAVLPPRVPTLAAVAAFDGNTDAWAAGRVAAIAAAAGANGPVTVWAHGDAVRRRITAALAPAARSSRVAVAWDVVGARTLRLRKARRHLEHDVRTDFPPVVSDRAVAAAAVAAKAHSTSPNAATAQATAAPSRATMAERLAARHRNAGRPPSPAGRGTGRGRGVGRGVSPGRR